MVNSRKSKAIFSATICVLCVSFLALGQQNVGRITGVVRDPSGAVVPTAVVTATALATGVTLQVAVNDGGAYAFPSLLTGEYKLTAQATGFKTIERPGIQIVASAALVTDPQLELGQVSESVHVSG